MSAGGGAAGSDAAFGRAYFTCRTAPGFTQGFTEGFNDVGQASFLRRVDPSRRWCPVPWCPVPSCPAPASPGRPGQNMLCMRRANDYIVNEGCVVGVSVVGAGRDRGPRSRCGGRAPACLLRPAGRASERARRAGGGDVWGDRDRSGWLSTSWPVLALVHAHGAARPHAPPRPTVSTRALDDDIAATSTHADLAERGAPPDCRLPCRRHWAGVASPRISPAMPCQRVQTASSKPTSFRCDTKA